MDRRIDSRTQAEGPDTDRVLACAAANGSREALGELYRRHAQDLFRLALQLTGSVQDAEDVLHDVFVGLPRALERYREQGRFGGWLKRVTVRVALMRGRGRRALSPLDPDTFVPPEGTGPVERVAAARALAAMPHTLRLVFVLTEVEGYSHAEAAALLDISVGASRTRLHRAWTFLRDRLGPES